jgi:hypothetical protein
MKNIFAKYEFLDPTEWATYKNLITDEEGNAINCAFIELGNICLATDEEGKCTNQSPLFAVDILWYIEPKEDFAVKEVWPSPVGIHTFAGLESLYEERYYEKYPDKKPEFLDYLDNS